jgi:hypothetical protein
MHRARRLAVLSQPSVGRLSLGNTRLSLPTRSSAHYASFSTGKSRFDSPEAVDEANVGREDGPNLRSGGVRVDEKGALPEGATLKAIELTRQWADKVVIGLRLCPFARMDETRIVCATPDRAKDLDSFLDLLRSEVQVLRDQPQVRTAAVVVSLEVSTH